MLNHQRELTLPRLAAAPTATSSAYCFNTPVSVAQVDLWRSDLNLLAASDGTLPWIYDALAGFLAGGA